MRDSAPTDSADEPTQQAWPALGGPDSLRARWPTALAAVRRHAQRWTTVLDLLTVALLAGAACVAHYGGFQEVIGPVRIIVRSWQRVLYFGVGVSVVRHLLVPRPAQPERVWLWAH